MKVSVGKKTSNKKVIAKKPLTNLYEMNSRYLFVVDITYIYMTSQTEADLDQFLGETHTFEEYKIEVEKLFNYVEEITYNSIKVNRLQCSMKHYS